MSAKTTHFKEKAIERIVTLLNEDGFNITPDNVKVWGSDRMNIVDVMNGIRHVNELGRNIVVYTNIVPHKERLGLENNVRIMDQEDILELALRHKDYNLYDMIA